MSEDQTPQTYRGPGRPTKHTPELEAVLFANLEAGMLLGEACKDVGVDRSTVWDWEQQDPLFSQRLTRARRLGYDKMAEDCIPISDALDPETGRPKLKADARRDKLRVWTRLQLLERLYPEKYGNITQHIGGRDPNAPPIEHHHTLDPGEAYRRMKDGTK